MKDSQSNQMILVLASTNEGKINEFRQFLSHFELTLQAQPKGVFVDETGQTFAENARLKALSVAKVTGHCSLADDSGLCVEALNGEPGVRSARYALNDEARINRLLSELDGHLNRRAFFSAAICVASPSGEVLIEVEGHCDGVIADSPRGINGFGYDPIFEVGSTGLTFAEMEIGQKRLLGHRGRAFALLEPRLKKIL